MATSQLETSLLKLILKSDKPLIEDLKLFIKLFGKKYSGKVSINKDCWRSNSGNELQSIRISMPYTKTTKNKVQEFTITWVVSHIVNTYLKQSQINICASRITLKNAHSYHMNDQFYLHCEAETFIRYPWQGGELTEEDVEDFMTSALRYALRAYDHADKRRIRFEKRQARLKAKRERIRLNMFATYGLKDNIIANEAFDVAFSNTGMYDPDENDVERQFKVLAYFLKADPNANDPVEQLTESK